MQTSIKTLCHLLVASSLPAFVAAAQAADAPRSNPLLVESTLPLHFPRFDQFRDEDFQPALEQGIAEHRKDGWTPAEPVVLPLDTRASMPG